MRLPAVLLLLLLAASVARGHSDSSCPFHDHGHDEPHDHHGHGHGCGGAEDHHHHHHHGDGDGHGHDHRAEIRQLLPEEMAEEADLELESFGYDPHDHGHGHHHSHDHDHHHHHHGHGGVEPETSPMGVWLSAMGCSLLVSMASLVCLVLLPVIFFQGKPSKAMVDALAVFGAGAMLGDSFLHQLPHAFGGGHSHSHDHDSHSHGHEHAHAHSLEDLSVGLSILFGIVLFFIVEKIVRYVEDNSQNGVHSLGHGHHHHHHKRHESIDKERSNHAKADNEGKNMDQSGGESSVNGVKINDETESKATIRKRSSSSSSKATDGEPTNSEIDHSADKAFSSEDSCVSNSNLVFGYLNLFSDGVHNFTDGMALGSAFLLHGSVGGWSRTLFLLAHELPQEVGDFGILVRSGFTVSKALFFNFLSALVALAGTALALSLGKDPGHSSLIEGFTAGGFIYIAVAGVLPQMNDQKTTLKSTVVQLISLTMGMLVALGISLVE